MGKKKGLEKGRDATAISTPEQSLSTAPAQLLAPGSASTEQIETQVQESLLKICESIRSCCLNLLHEPEHTRPRGLMDPTLFEVALLWVTRSFTSIPKPPPDPPFEQISWGHLTDPSEFEVWDGESAARDADNDVDAKSIRERLIGIFHWEGDTTEEELKEIVSESMATEEVLGEEVPRPSKEREHLVQVEVKRKRSTGKCIFECEPLEAADGNWNFIASLTCIFGVDKTLFSCTVVSQEIVLSLGQGLGKCSDGVKVIKDIVGTEEAPAREICDTFFSNLARGHDEADIPLTITYTKTDAYERTLVALGWKHEPISQLRIRICGVLPRSKDWGTIKYNRDQFELFATCEDLNNLDRLSDGNGPSIMIVPHPQIKRQVEKYHPECNTDPSFSTCHKIGACANTGRGDVYPWISWIQDDARRTLRVNRVAARRPHGNTLDLLGLLTQCLDHAQAATENYDIVVWDPPEELYHAAIALADDEKTGRFLRVYKEPVDCWKAYVRWHPKFKEVPVWKDRQFYCFPGSLEGGD